MHKPEQPARSNLSFYLAGSIKKGHESPTELFWSEVEMDCLREGLKGFEVNFLNPATRTDDLSDQKSVFGRDMMQVFCADAVIVDVRQRRGLGVGAEMMWAKANNIPVICYAPLDTHYNMSKTSLLGVDVKNWVHPFVESISDCLATSLEEAAIWIRTHFAEKPYPIKGLDYMRSTMAYYHETQYPQDVPMQELINASEALQRKMRLVAAT